MAPVGEQRVCRWWFEVGIDTVTATNLEWGDVWLLPGYLLKENSAGRWQRRWFEILDHFFVYYKVSEWRLLWVAPLLTASSDPPFTV